jgi:hypothetical protein
VSAHFSKLLILLLKIQPDRIAEFMGVEKITQPFFLTQEERLR